MRLFRFTGPNIGLKLFPYLVYLSFFVLSVDFVYRTINDINYMNRSKCILNQIIPPLLFLFYEYFIELAMIVIVGIFIAVVLQAWFSRFYRFFPTNPVTAFLYASVLPVCSCSVLPLLETLDEKLSYRTLITFIVAAPLLNPYIIVLSFTVLGPLYAVLRIFSSFLLAVCAGFVLELFSGGKQAVNKHINFSCDSSNCVAPGNSPFEKSYHMFKKIIPYLVIAGILGIVSELLLPMQFMGNLNIGTGLKSLLVFVLVGIPIYFCNGTDVLFLRPLICNGMGMGTAIAFSLTSTAICISSFVMLLKFLGKKQTVILTLFILISTILLGVAINLLLG